MVLCIGLVLAVADPEILPGGIVLCWLLFIILLTGTQTTTFTTATSWAFIFLTFVLKHHMK
jgi:hypothetical protein